MRSLKDEGFQWTDKGERVTGVGSIGGPVSSLLRCMQFSNFSRDGQTSPHRPRLVVSHSACPPLSPSPHENSFVIGTAVINNNVSVCFLSQV
jgi:hypothetical protein